MRACILIVAFAAIIVLGYIQMKKLDVFLTYNEEEREKETNIDAEKSVCKETDLHSKSRMVAKKVL